MRPYSTRQAAGKLGLHAATLARYIESGKVPAPTILKVGSASLHAWTEEEIERVRKLLPKIANGRKTRYQKSGDRSQKSVKTKSKKQPPPRVATATSTAVPHKQSKKK